MNTRLRDAIQALLSEHLRGLLLAAETRTPVLGSTSIARPETREISEIPDEWIKKYIYHGWLSWYPQAYPGGPPPARVYCGAELYDYLIGEGTEIPNSDPVRTETIIGRVYSHTELCAPSRRSPTWKNGPPDLSENKSYLWPFDNPSDASPSLIWTGEARLMDQALKGSRRSWSDVLPESFAVSPTNIGVFWIENDLYAVSAGINGIFIARLTVSGQVACCLLWLLLGEFSGIDEQLIRALIYSQAIEDKTFQILEIASETEVSDVYSYGSSLHSGLGWQWYWQPNLDDPAQAIQTVTRWTGTTWESKTFTLVFSASMVDGDLIPSVDISSTSATEWGGPLFRLRLEDGSMLSPMGTNNAQEAVVHSFTTADGGMCQLVKLGVTAGGTINTSIPSFPTLCGGASWSGGGGTQTRVAKGGWKIIGTTGCSAEIDLLSASTWEARSVSNSATTHNYSGKYNDSPQNNPSNMCSHSGTLPLNTLNCNVGNIGHYYFQKATLTTTKTYTTLSSGYGSAIASFLPYDNGVAIGEVQHWGSGTERQSVVVNNNVCQGGDGTQRYVVNCSTITDRPYSFVAKIRPTTFSNAWGGTASSYISGSITQNLDGGYDSQTIAYTGPAYTPSLVTGAMRLVGSDGVLRELNISDWNGFMDLTALDAQEVPLMRVSWKGGAIWTDAPGADAHVPDGISPDALNGVGICPIGMS